jgi:maltose O-acetyltransferase
MSRTMEVVGADALESPLRLVLADLLARLMPDYYAYELRAGLYRWAGCQLGPRVAIYGRLDLFGSRRKARNLSIAAGSNVAPHCVLELDGKISIGRTVGLAPFVRVFTSGPSRRRGATAEPWSITSQSPQPVAIADGAVIMTGATILPGVTIGRGAIVGAGAVVSGDVAPCTFVGGVPAQVIRQLPEGPVD